MGTDLLERAPELSHGSGDAPPPTNPDAGFTNESFFGVAIDLRAAVRPVAGEQSGPSFDDPEFHPLEFTEGQFSWLNALAINSHIRLMWYGDITRNECMSLFDPEVDELANIPALLSGEMNGPDRFNRLVEFTRNCHTVAWFTPELTIEEQFGLADTTKPEYTDGQMFGIELFDDPLTLSTMKLASEVITRLTEGQFLWLP